MRTTNALSWAWLGALAVAASCAQGSNDPDVSGLGLDGGIPTLDGGILDTGSPVANDAPGNTNPEDSGSGTGNDAPSNDDSGGAGDDSGAQVDSAPPVDSGGNVGSDASSAVPTTCAQADTTYGCCVGNELYYCASAGSSSVTRKGCSGGQVCGWDGSKGYYYCVASPGGADPSGMYPIACE